MSAIYGERLVFGQHNGPDLTLIVFGDEFYARYETEDGFTVIYDLDRGLYCYAILSEGQFVSSAIPLSKPVPVGIRRHLKESGNVRNQKFKRQYQLKRARAIPLSASSNVMRTYGPNSGLLEGRMISNGNIKGLTILVDFDDLQSSITFNDVEALLNGQNYTENGNFCSVNQYFKLMSTGKLDYINKVVGPVKLSKKQSYYINNLLIEEALQIAVDKFHLDLSEFDSREEGLVDAVSFMYAGRSLYSGNLWPHNSFQDINIGDYKTHFYTVQSLGRNNVDLSIGTFAHETGHMLCRFPDLYDYGERDGDLEQSSGLGQYCLMSWGNHLGEGKRPSPICAYLRDLAGWCDNEINLNNPGAYEAKHGDYGTVMRFRTDKSHEYYLIENRHKEDLDLDLPDQGLAIYHCDTRGSNEYQDGTPDNHYQCALIQADGHFDLEKTPNGGDDGDLFENLKGTAVSNATNPNSREWDGTDSGLIISGIGPSGSVISFKTGAQSGGDHTVSNSVVADLIIPDDDPAGVSSIMEIQKSGILTRITVDVNITHTHRGDLKITLMAPSKKEVVLYRNKGGKLDNLNLSLDSGSLPALKKLAGEFIEGIWTLKVVDNFKDDVGRLDNWGLKIEYDDDQQIIKGEVTPGIIIPDAKLSGIESVINIVETGKAKSVSVEVDITHTFRGDIRIELITPSKQHVQLESGNGKSGTNIRETYNEYSRPALKALVNTEINGKWVLHVIDTAASDEGTLNRWALKIAK